MPEGLLLAEQVGLLDAVADLSLLHADGGRDDNVSSALKLIQAGAIPAPRNLLPIAVVDESSLACVVCKPPDDQVGAEVVVRWFVTDVPAQHQAALLDSDAFDYLESIDQEIAARPAGLSRILDEIGPAYEQAYIKNEKRPRDFVVRPVRIACQNVIVALAAIAQDASFDGLSVVAWQTCEVPHVATHEGNRALAALTLADAFQNGGTMEIRFDRAARVAIDGKVVEYDGHPEKAVPASLRRFARTVGVSLGESDPGSISPAEARGLFLAITPMPEGLRSRVATAVESRGITPERLCFTLLSQTWREIELDFMLGCSDRAASILEGGADWRERSTRQVEMDFARNALMVGMLYRRLNGKDAAGAIDAPRVIEDASAGVRWKVLDEIGAVEFSGLPAGTNLPWLHGPPVQVDSPLTVFFRSHLSHAVAGQINKLQGVSGPVAVAVPLDADVPGNLVDAPLLRCPDRVADLDKQAEARLLTSRISRG